jgi:phosphoglycolate phosphatase-like HAD superfamily hydrolase
LRLLLDLDGTLIKLGVDWAEVRRRVEPIVGCPPPGMTIFAWLSRVEDEARVREALRVVEEAELEGLRSATVDREVAELLQALKEGGCRLALVSMQGSRAVEGALRELGLEGAFDVVVTRDFSLSREHQLREALRVEGGGEAVFLCDRGEDVEAAAKLGIQAVKARLADGSVKEALRSLLAKLGRLSQP